MEKKKRKKMKSKSEITQLCLTPSDPMDCSLRGSSIYGIFQARVLEWVAIAFSRVASGTHIQKLANRPPLQGYMEACSRKVPQNPGSSRFLEDGEERYAEKGKPWGRLFPHHFCTGL